VIGPAGFMAGPKPDRGPERCEWNPRFNKPSSDPPAPGDCQNEAILCVGRSPNWHLCESCAAESRFKRFRVRVPLKELAEAGLVTDYTPNAPTVSVQASESVK